MITKFIYDDKIIKEQNLDIELSRGSFVVIDGVEYIVSKSIYVVDQYCKFLYLNFDGIR